MASDYYYLEYHNDAKNSHKFYMGIEDGDGGLLVWGRIGSRGQAKKKSPSEVSTMMTEKLKKGYVDKTDEAPNDLLQAYVGQHQFPKKKHTPSRNTLGLLNWTGFLRGRD